MTERREYVRFTIDQMIELSYGREQFIQAKGVNLSEKGILCRTSEIVEAYSRVFLMFHLPTATEAREIKCEGIIIRSSKSGDEFVTAISFAELNESDRSAIEEYSRGLIAGKG